MKSVGLLGGMSWESSIEYYRIINTLVREELGGLHSARIVMVSVDFAEIEELQKKGDWEEATRIMINNSRVLEEAGADFLVICTNTMHLMAEQISQDLTIPLLHIADATALVVKQTGCSTVGLLGTRFTMEEDFYRGRLEDRHGLEVLLPDQSGREQVHRVIYEELVQGKILEESRQAYQNVISDLVQAGAEGIILGCTEIGLLVQEQDVPVPVFDTMEIHARIAVEAALGRYTIS